MKVVYFATTSDFKMSEATRCLKPHGIAVTQVDPGDISEVLSTDLIHVSRTKALHAFKALRIPLFCEHGGLSVRALEGLPGCMSKLFNDALGDKLCDLVPTAGDRSAIAMSALTYCDGRRLHTYVGEMHGSIPSRARGTRRNYYGRVFVPDGQPQTFAEMSPLKKMNYSHVKIAYDQFAEQVLSGG